MSRFLNNSASTSEGALDVQMNVVIPTYRRPKLLARALDSVRNQAFTGFECIIVNDSPCDRVVLDELLTSFGDSRFRLLHNETNMGGNYCRNRGIRESSAPIIAFLDDDDEWGSEKLAKHYQVHSSCRSPVVVYSGYTLRWIEGARPDQVRLAENAPTDVPGEMILGRFCPATTSSVTVDRQCFSDVGVFDELLPSLQDWDMWFRISRKFEFVAISECLNVFHQHAGDRASINWEKRMRALDLIEEKYNSDTSVDFGDLRRKITDSAFISNVVNYAGANEYWNGLSFIFTNRKRLLGDVGCRPILTACLRLFSPQFLVDIQRTFRDKLTKKELHKKRGTRA